MPRLILMSDIRTRCQRRSDRENDPSIQTAEWNAYISERYGELWSIVCQTGLRYFETVYTITTTGALYYAEPTDHYETVAVYQVYTDGTRRELSEAMEQERARMSGMSGDALKYSLIDDRLYLYPAPSGQTYEMLYVPQPTDLSSYADGGVVDVVTPDGESFLVWGVAVMALHKQESDVSVAVAEREAARLRFTEEAQLRSLKTPRRRIVRDDSLDDYLFDPADWRWGR